MKFVHLGFRDSDLSLSPVLIPLFRPFRDWFRQIVVRPGGWRVGLPRTIIIAQITLSSVKLCLSLSEVYCSRTV